MQDDLYVRSHNEFVFSVIYKEIPVENYSENNRAHKLVYQRHKIHSNGCNIQGNPKCIIDNHAKEHENFNYLTVLEDERIPQIMGNDSIIFNINYTPQTIGLKGHIGMISTITYDNALKKQGTPSLLTKGTCRENGETYQWAIGYVEYEYNHLYNFDEFLKSLKLQNYLLWNHNSDNQEQIPSLKEYIL